MKVMGWMLMRSILRVLSTRLETLVKELEIQNARLNFS